MLNTPKITVIHDVAIREQSMVIDCVGTLAGSLSIPKPSNLADAHKLIERLYREHHFFALLGAGLLLGRSANLTQLRNNVQAVKGRRLITDFSQTGFANVLKLES